MKTALAIRNYQSRLLCIVIENLLCSTCVISCWFNLSCRPNPQTAFRVVVDSTLKNTGGLFQMERVITHFDVIIINIDVVI